MTILRIISDNKYEYNTSNPYFLIQFFNDFKIPYNKETIYEDILDISKNRVNIVSIVKDELVKLYGKIYVTYDLLDSDDENEKINYINIELL